MMAEQVLWQTVVIRNLMDALSPDKRTAPKRKAGPTREKREADSWFRHGGRDFFLVCHLAGLDANWLRDKYVSGQISYAALKSADKADAA